MATVPDWLHRLPALLEGAIATILKVAPASPAGDTLLNHAPFVRVERH